MKSKTMSVLAAVGLIGAAVAVGAKEAKPQRPEHKPDAAGRMRARQQPSADRIRAYLLEKYPEEMKAIEAKQNELMERRKALYKKAMDEMSDADREALGIASGRKIAERRRAAMYAREKYQEEFKALMELRKTDGEGAAEKMRALLTKAAEEMPADWQPTEREQKRQMKGEGQRQQRRGDAQERKGK